MTVRRGVALIVFLLVFAVFISLVGLMALYAVFGRQPAVRARSTLVVRLSGDLSEGAGDAFGQFLPGTRRPTVRGVIENLRRARQDPRIAALLLLPTDFASPYWAKVQEIRDAVVDFRRSGKPAIAFLEYGGDREYYLASACDRVYLLPSSPLDVKGLASYSLFLRGTLDKIGAYPDLHHIGDYKTASNQLTETGFTPAHRQMAESLNHEAFAQMVSAIADGRRKSETEVRRLIDQGPFLPEEAVRVGLVDDLAYEDQVTARLPDHNDARKIDLEDYARAGGGFRRGQRVALLYVSGTIVSGRSGYDPLNGSVVGSDTLVDSLQKIRGDQSIRALVVRIDSPGGSAIASDVIWRELTVTRTGKGAKPIVVSMSDLAASGGYYLAIAAPTIVAEPGTLTGSIGIFGGKVVTGGTYSKLGMNVEGVTEGRNADMNSPVRPYSEEERSKLEEQLQAFYDQFVEKVAQSRHVTPERIDAVAQGRVWTGRQAREIGLVDALGGLDKAIAFAKQAAKIPAAEPVELVVYPPRRSVYDLLASQFLGGDDADRMRLLAGLVGRRSLGTLAAPLVLFRRGEPLALMPFAFTR